IDTSPTSTNSIVNTSQPSCSSRASPAFPYTVSASSLSPRNSFPPNSTTALISLPSISKAVNSSFSPNTLDSTSSLTLSSAIPSSSSLSPSTSSPVISNVVV